uniref:NADH-ubiquinone oxidoreductase chain 2 n=1 Tax=Matuta planipes TaxID=1235672 RepID=A0A6C0T1V7_MATPL|nr:NADH dehydrogenase subunit 2 [Matuta planipes]
MLFPSSYLVFFITLISGTVISISSSSWFGAWIGLELNLMSFIPLITTKPNSFLSESALKYFLIQALASTIIVLSASLFLSMYNVAAIFMLLSLLLKLGAAPFHFWFPQVMEGLLWPQCLILLTIQKLAPMFLISYLTFNSSLIKIIITFSMLSALIGALGGLNLTKLRKIMAFSSINHMSWMLILISMNDSMWLIYFLFYAFISSSIIFILNSSKLFSLSEIYNLNSTNPLFFLLISSSLFSLSGLPPFSGFIPKWLTIQTLLNNSMFFTLAILLFSTLITLYFYLRIMYPMVMFLNPVMTLNTKLVNSSNFSFYSPVLLIVNLFGLLTPLFFFLL